MGSRTGFATIHCVNLWKSLPFMIQISRKKQNVIGKILSVKGLWNKYFFLLGIQFIEVIQSWSVYGPPSNLLEKHNMRKKGGKLSTWVSLRNFYPNPIKHVHLTNGYYLNIWYNRKCIKEITCFKSMRKLFNSLMPSYITDGCQDAKMAKWRAH